MKDTSDLKEIVELSDSIRKKYQMLKRGSAETDVLLQKTFKPIVDPLQTLVKEKKRKRIKTETEVKKEIKSEYQDDNDEVFPETLKHDDVFPKTLNLETLVESTPIAEKVLEETLSTPEGAEYIKHFLQQYGPLASKYMILYVTDDKTIDKTLHGLRYVDNEWQFGNKTFTVDKEDNIYIDDTKYEGTPGLFELIFLKEPNQDIITKTDYDMYVKILNTASVLKKRYDPFGSGQGSRSKKYVSIIAPRLRSKSGTGFIKHYHQKAPDLVYWDDPNELVERLILLIASKDAGHSNHDNEILSITEELREAGYIE